MAKLAQGGLPADELAASGRRLKELPELIHAVTEEWESAEMEIERLSS